MAKTNKNIEITVIIPVWNLDRELRDAVASIRDQQVPVELVIVDNASDSPLPPIPGAEWIRLKERVSIGEARNIALAKVTTPYVFFADADDIVEPGLLKFLRGQLKTRPRAVLAAGKEVLWNPETGEKRLSSWPFDYAYRLQRHRLRFALRNSLRDICPAVGYVLLRTEAAQRAGGFAKMNFAEDWCLSVALAFQGEVILTEQPGRLYRVSGGTQPRLSRLAKGKVGLRWQAQREARRRLRTAPGVPLLVRLTSPLWVVPHLVLLVTDVLRTRR